MPSSHSPGARAARAIAVLVCALAGCGSCDEHPSAAAPAPAELDQQPPAAPPPPAAEEEPPDAGNPYPFRKIVFPKPGFSKVLLVDKIPICAFPDYRTRDQALTLDKVKKQKLNANSSMVIGAFGPWCVTPECDDRPLIQCWIDRDGDTLIVNTRYSGAHKDGATCPTTGCVRMTAACESPVLAPGKYTIKHGDKTYPLKIPSVLRKPCFTD